jgi:hypothetical protein
MSEPDQTEGWSGPFIVGPDLTGAAAPPLCQREPLASILDWTWSGSLVCTESGFKSPLWNLFVLVRTLLSIGSDVVLFTVRIALYNTVGNRTRGPWSGSHSYLGPKSPSAWEAPRTCHVSFELSPMVRTTLWTSVRIKFEAPNLF